MKIRVRNLLVLLFILASGALLLHTSQKVEIAENQVRTLEQKIAQEEDLIKILGAEWAFLNNPGRLEELAQKYLDVKPVAPTQLSADPAVYFHETPTEGPVSEKISAPAPAVTPSAQKIPIARKTAVKPEKNFNQLLQQVAGGKGQ